MTCQPRPRWHGIEGKGKVETMTQATHTPGPWEVREGCAIYAPKGFKPYSVRLADCLGYKEEREANARLVAAAPAMLEALREAVARVADIVNAIGKDCIAVEDLAAWSDDAADIVASIDGTPTAQPAPPTMGADTVTISAADLRALAQAASAYADDLASGLSDGTYDDEAGLSDVRAALERVAPTMGIEGGEA